MPRCLPLNSSLNAIEKEARHFLHEVCRGDATAMARWHSLDHEARTRQPRVADLQYVIAREYGFKSWQNLKDQLAKDDPSLLQGKARQSNYFEESLARQMHFEERPH
jgi:hypothetical protein